MATPKWLKDVMDKSSRAGGMARSRANAPTKKELQKASEQAKKTLTNIGLTMIPVGLIGTKIGQQLAKGYGKAISSGITNTLQRGGSSKISKDILRKENLKNPFIKGHYGNKPGKQSYYTLPTTMTPDQFLKLSSRVNLNTPKKQKKLKEMAGVIFGTAKGKAGKSRAEIDFARTSPFFAVVNTKQGLKIEGHEGRHRAATAKLKGVKEIPVDIKFGIPVKKIPKNQKMTLIGQEGSTAQRFKRRYGKKK